MLIAAAACLCLSQAAAQGDPEKAAKAETDRLQKELQLTDKQYKKVYKLVLKEQKERLENRPPMPAGGRGDMPPRRDGGRPQMPQGGGEGFPSMGGEDGFPPQMQMGQGGDDRPFRDNRQDRAEEMKKKAEKQEKKMKKILTDEQFAKWKEMQAPMPGHRPGGKHPARKQREEQPEAAEGRLTDR